MTFRDLIDKLKLYEEPDAFFRVDVCYTHRGLGRGDLEWRIARGVGEVYVGATSDEAYTKYAQANRVDA